MSDNIKTIDVFNEVDENARLIDPLLPIGSRVFVSVAGPPEPIEPLLIIGRRSINPRTFKVWDYSAVRLEEGHQNTYVKSAGEWTSNLVYFNHDEIVQIIDKPQKLKISKKGTRNNDDDSENFIRRRTYKKDLKR